MSIEVLSFMGLPECIKISNGVVDVIVATTVGPRILFYGPMAGVNAFAEYPQNSKETALGVWKPYGGHRLWVWPELFPATYAPDSEPVEHTDDGNLCVRLRQTIDAAGMQKELRIQLSSDGTGVSVEQRITNHCLWPVEIAAWGISVTSQGLAVIPREPFQSHDRSVAAAQPLALYPFTDLQDPRFTLGLSYLLVRTDPSRPGAQKIGLLNKQGWCAHLAESSLFVKAFDCQEGANYPDYGVNNEIYVEGSYMEIEVLGPKRIVTPGDSISLTEHWKLFQGVGLHAGARDIDSLHSMISEFAVINQLTQRESF